MKSYAQRMKKPQIANLQQSTAVGAPLGNQAMGSLMGYDASKSKSDPTLEDKMRAKLQKQFNSPNQEAHREPGGVPLPPAIQKEYEEKSGVLLDDIRVHYDSDKPELVDADAFCFGNKIYIAPGQEHNLRHEVGHAIQQKCSVVVPTKKQGNLPLNDSEVLENAASSEKCAEVPPQIRTPQLRLPVIQKSPSPPARRKRSIGRKVHKSVTPSQKQVLAKKTSRISAKQGTHGFKKYEQALLTSLFGSGVSGSTHESEHAIGFAVLNNSGISRKALLSFENALPAYQERKAMHRGHIGTGTHRKETIDSHGFDTDRQYRTHQYAAFCDEALSNGTDGYQTGVSNAIQLNQLGYSGLYKSISPTDIATTQSNKSFYNMAKEMVGTKVPYYPHTHTSTPIQRFSPPVSSEAATEMILSRLAMQTGHFPSVSVENRVRNMFGVPQMMDVEQTNARVIEVEKSTKYKEAETKMHKILDDMIKEIP